MKRPIPLQEQRRRKALGLQAFQPGVVITIPLSVAPEYFQLHQLEPMDRRGVQDLIDQHVRRVDGIVWVKPITAEKEDGHV